MGFSADGTLLWKWPATMCITSKGRRSPQCDSRDTVERPRKVICHDN